MLLGLPGSSGVPWNFPRGAVKVQGDSLRAVADPSHFLVHTHMLRRACLPMLKNASRENDPSRVINIGSVTGYQHQPFPTYSGTIKR